MKIKLLTIVTILLATAWMTPAQKTQAPTPPEQDVRKLERSWLDAYEKKDAAAMTAIVADDFTITFPDGSVQTKQQVVDSVKGNASSMKFRTENVQSRAYGDTVVLIGLVVSEWKQGEQVMSDRSRYTDTYVKRNGKWQVVASHLSAAGK
jgi:ketosteroid isomerase-like protein